MKVDSPLRVVATVVVVGFVMAVVTAAIWLVVTSVPAHR